ncbi:hypothetical protein NC653_015153 [Populus alba x Populus x berolinensis]|uniref:Uncharacterized protein n=1 Tax=Populus alba x Populus x berolinensis TaxID=444605 RepID=A0AAD6QZ70_9ROSI|nr:hypothetical protein NC653_015153 [Populus alba x Populus x berolinensis]
MRRVFHQTTFTAPAPQILAGTSPLEIFPFDSWHQKVNSRRFVECIITESNLVSLVCPSGCKGWPKANINTVMKKKAKQVGWQIFPNLSIKSQLVNQ